MIVSNVDLTTELHCSLGWPFALHKTQLGAAVEIHQMVIEVAFKGVTVCDLMTSMGCVRSHRRQMSLCIIEYAPGKS